MREFSTFIIYFHRGRKIETVYIPVIFPVVVGVYLGQSEGSLDTESQESSLDDNSQAITSQEDDDEGSYAKDEL